VIDSIFGDTAQIASWVPAATTEANVNLGLLAWIGLIGALGGTVLTGVITLLTSRLSERGKADALRFEERREDAKVKREAFASYLNAALLANNAVSEAMRSALKAAKDQGQEGTPVLGQFWAQSAELKSFNEREAALLFLLDDVGVEAVTNFALQMIRSAAMSGLDEATPTWNEQIAEVLAAMRRSLDLK